MSRPAALVLTPMGLRYGNRLLPCTIGKGGITVAKREGDGATPAGFHRIIGMYYRPDRMPSPAPWAEPIGPRDLWCDAPGHPDYNLPVQAPFRPSHEKMRRADPLYDLVMVVDWNYPIARPGAGSAIFIHRWRRPGAPTEGCIALSPANLLWLAQRLPPGTSLLIPPYP